MRCIYNNVFIYLYALIVVLIVNSYASILSLILITTYLKVWFLIPTAKYAALLSMIFHFISISSSASADTNQNDPGSIDIAAFNVQVFGRAKMRKTFVAENLAKVPYLFPRG